MGEGGGEGGKKCLHIQDLEIFLKIMTAGSAVILDTFLDNSLAPVNSVRGNWKEFFWSSAHFSDVTSSPHTDLGRKVVNVGEFVKNSQWESTVLSVC